MLSRLVSASCVVLPVSNRVSSPIYIKTTQRRSLRDTFPAKWCVFAEHYFRSFSALFKSEKRVAELLPYTYNMVYT